MNDKPQIKLSETVVFNFFLFTMKSPISLYIAILPIW